MSSRTLRHQMLVTTDWLEEHLSDPNLRIVDIRGVILPVSQPPPWYFSSRAAYQQSHIPGAIFVDWLEDLVDEQAPIKATAVSPETFAAVMSRLGIGNHHKIVIYDDDGCHIAARLWWMLQYAGHTQAALLDGGWPKWQAEHRPTTAEITHHPPTLFQLKLSPQEKAEMADVQQSLRTQDSLLIDCRGPDLYKGKATRGHRKGRIPGSVNVPITSLVTGPYQTWRSDEDLQQIFHRIGVTEQTPIITYCNAGVSASVGHFALRMLQHPQVRNYDGSWYEWETDPQNPIESES